MKDPARDAWSDFWDQGGDVDNPAGGAVLPAVRGERQTEALRHFWRDALAARIVTGGRVRMLDAACGSGMVGRIASELARAAPAWQLELHFTDYSAPAVTSTVRALHPTVAGGTAADARHLPYCDGSFDLVVSQFGIEYAGLDGFREAARVVRPTGAFCALVHQKEGAIYQECAGNLEVLDAVERSGLFRLHERLITLGAKVDQGKAAPSALTRIMASTNQAWQSLETVAGRARHGAARDHVQRLLADLQRISDRRANYAADELRIWIAGQSAALGAYRTRMQSMLDAALDREAVEGIAALFADAGLGAISIGELTMVEGAPPAAWTFSASMA